MSICQEVLGYAGIINKPHILMANNDMFSFHAH